MGDSIVSSPGVSHSDESVTTATQSPSGTSPIGNGSRVSMDFQDLSPRYFGIGCIRFANDKAGKSFHQWRDINASEVRESSLALPLRDHIWRLRNAHWVRVQQRCTAWPSKTIWRIFILPEDVGRGQIDRSSKSNRKALEQLLPHLEIAPEIWNGEHLHSKDWKFDPWAEGEDSSLYYLFNTMPSPNPDPSTIEHNYTRAAVSDLLSSRDSELGLRTTLHPYQRRTAAMMIQREAAPKMQLDPRMELRYSPDGRCYYYNARDRLFYEQPRFYDSCRGGILAETMGLGKTIICIATILCTKGHLPQIPPQYACPAPVRKAMSSLFDIAASIVARNTKIVWPTFFARVARSQGYEMDHCIEAIKKDPPQYEIPPRIIRSNRISPIYGKGETVRMAGGTIIVVPRNLVQQWQSELEKHVFEDVLRVLILDDSKQKTPPLETLVTYDLILFSLPRFEWEFRATYLPHLSPFRGIHWLRMIIDEGHGFSNATSNAATMAEKYIRVERRWIVSGTPAKDLLGVEVETMTEGDVISSRMASLQVRRRYDQKYEQRSGAVKALGALASRFLQAQPWSSKNIDGYEDEAEWDEYVYRHQSARVRTNTLFSSCLERTLRSLVVKTQPEDVERDMILPPLSHRIVRLPPSLYDKFTANLFVMIFTTNAVTSERTDIDYLFHKNSQPHLQRLIHNLRHSGFIWAGFNEDIVTSSLGVIERYLSKDGTKCSNQDRNLLVATAEAAKVALSSSVWQGLGTTQEMGMFLDYWPTESLGAWAFDQCARPMAMSLGHLRQAQKLVNSQLGSMDPTKGFADAGRAAKIISAVARREQNHTREDKKPKTFMVDGTETNVLESPVKKRISVSGITERSSSNGSPGKRKRSSSPSEYTTELSIKEQQRRFAMAKDSGITLDPTSDLGRCNLLGTTSAKCSYLIDQVATHYKTEKILIFYDGNDIAFYLAEVFDVLNIKYLIYANTLSGAQRSRYIVLFDTDASQRVLLMDIKQAAHGLNLSSASRVFFINPVFRPNVEAQAIKRSHRIGQTRPVHVETLVLKDTIEEAMHHRAANMTNGEHIQAKTLEEDEGIRGILQNAKILPVHPHEMQGHAQMALLSTPQQIFGRPDRHTSKTSKLEQELFGEEDKAQTSKRQKRKPLAERRTGNAEPVGTDVAPVWTSAPNQALPPFQSIFGRD